MRSFFTVFTMLLLTLLLLYAGLNLTERNLSELMGLEREAAAFTVVRDSGGTFTLTFSGAAVTLNIEPVQTLLNELLSRIFFFQSSH